MNSRDRIVFELKIASRITSDFQRTRLLERKRCTWRGTVEKDKAEQNSVSPKRYSRPSERPYLSALDQEKCSYLDVDNSLEYRAESNVFFAKHFPVTVYELHLRVRPQIGPDIACLTKPAELAGNASEQRRCCLAKSLQTRRLEPSSHTRRGVVAHCTVKMRQDKAVSAARKVAWP